MFWQRTNRMDLPNPARPDHRVALYDLNATPYERLILGMFAIFRGPKNDICAQEGVPKNMDLELGCSRDGFHFSHIHCEPFLASSRRIGTGIGLICTRSGASAWSIRCGPLYGVFGTFTKAKSRR